MQTVVFDNHHLDIIDHNGQPWLRLPQIGAALGYANPHKIQQVFSRNAAEFTPSMTAVVKQPTAGGEQEVRIFSLRGAHLLAMFARTARAAEFRRWVLDVLEAHTAQTPDTSLGQKSLGWVHSRPVPRLHFPQPPAVGQNRAGGRTIEAAQTIARAIEDWARHLPDARAAHDLQHAAQTLHALLVTGWTEVDEALAAINLGRHYLNRWQGRGGAVGNIR